MDEIKIIIPGQPIVKKNQAKTSMFDRSGKPRPFPVHYYSQAYKHWAAGAIVALQKFKSAHQSIKFPLEDRFNMKCLLFFDHEPGKTDLTNLLEASQDALAGNIGCFDKSKVPPHIYQIIVDDGIRFIGSVDGSRLLIDRTNPRTEITLTEFRY